MKSLFLALIVVCFSFFTSFSQKVNDEKVTFNYIRLPLNPIVGVTNYNTSIILQYENDIAVKKEEHQKRIAEAEVKYQQDMEAYKVAKQEAEAKYAAEMEEYNKKSNAEKFIEKKVLEEGKPVLRLPSVPYKNIPQEEKYSKIFNKDVLSGKMKLEGFNLGSDNAVKITVTLLGFQSIGPDLKSEERTESSNNTSYKVNYYWYETSYKHPMSIMVETPSQGVILNETPDTLSKFKQLSTNKVKNVKELNMNPSSYLAIYEDKVVDENMKYLNEFVNNLYGFSKVQRKIELNNVETKSFNYDDFQQAFEFALAGYNVLAAEKTKQEAKVSLNKAIELWENAMKESEPTNKKARINGNVTMATLFNLAEACIWVDDYAKTETYLNKILASDPSKKEKKAAEELRKFEKDMQLRYEASK